MDKYVVKLFSNMVDANGKISSEESEFEFPIDSLNAFIARKKAVEKAQELFSIYGNRKSGYSNIEELKAKGFKDYKSFSINIVLSVDDEPYTVIFGNGIDEDLEGLEYEVLIYKRNFHPYSTIKITRDDIDFVVFGEDIKFLTHL